MPGVFLAMPHFLSDAARRFLRMEVDFPATLWCGGVGGLDYAKTYCGVGYGGDVWVDEWM